MSAKLTAVNKVLRAIGEDPVNSLQDGLDDAEAAESVINEVTRDVLEIGWHCNTDEAVELLPDVNKHIVVPETILKVDTAGRDAFRDVTVRRDLNDDKMKLFDKDRQSFEFDGALTVMRVHLFPFDDLPGHLQRYIAARSARVAQETLLGSTSVDKFTVRQEAEALAASQDAEAELEDINLLTDNPHCALITGRINPLYGR